MHVWMFVSIPEQTLKCFIVKCTSLPRQVTHLSRSNRRLRAFFGDYCDRVHITLMPGWSAASRGEALAISA